MFRAVRRSSLDDVGLSRSTTEATGDRAAVARVASLLRRKPPSAELSADVRGAIAAFVPYGMACWGQLDPLSQLPVTNNRNSADATLARKAWISEFTHSDVNSVKSLLRAPHHVGVLSMATAGEVERSHRYRAILVPLGAADELRAVLSIGGLPWGWLVFFRFGGRFTSADAKRIAAIVPLLARSWRSAQLVPPMDMAEPSGPAMLVVDGSGRLEGVTPAGQVMLERLPPGTMGPVPDVISGLAATVRSSLPRDCAEARLNAPWCEESVGRGLSSRRRHCEANRSGSRSASRRPPATIWPPCCYRRTG